MTEGLLYKKIQKYTEDSHGYLAPECKVCLREFYKRFWSEAVADFPKLPTTTEYRNSNSVETPTSWAYHEYQRRCYEWREKWFGVLSQASSAEESCEEATKK